MADVLSVIQDVLNQDKQQKKEQAKIMREVNKKLKEKKGDKEEYMAFFKKTLDKYGVNSPAELSVADKKKFFNEIDAGWKGDDEKAEEVEEKESLGARVKARMEQEDDEEPEEDDDEDDDEPSEEEIDKIADLVVQKLKDKADEEEEKENEPDPTEAEGGKEEKIEIKPKMETIQNPHARSTWEEALRKVYTINEEVAPPIKPVIQSFGKKLHTYGKESGGMDKGLFMKIAKDAIGGKLPDPKFIQRQDTDPREFVLDMMAKEFGWKFTEQEYGVTFSNRRNYVEQVELEEVFSMSKGNKRVVDAFYDQKTIKAHGGSILTTDGKTLTKRGMGGQDIAKWVNGKIKIVAKMDVKSTEQIVNYMKKSIPSGVFEEVELDEKAKKIKQLHLFNTEKEAIKKAKEIGGQVAQNKRDGKYAAVIFEEVEIDERLKDGQMVTLTKDLKTAKKGFAKGEKVKVKIISGMTHIEHPEKPSVLIQVRDLKKYVKEEVELVEKEVAVPPTIDNLKKIVKDKQNQIFMFKDGKARVDAFSASAMTQVYNALKPATKKKFEDMIKTKAGFLKSQAFAMKMLEGVELDEGKHTEIEVGGYKTKYHYMCPSAVQFFKRHQRMDHNEEQMKALQDVVRLSDDVFEIEAEVQKTGKVSDEQIKTAERLIKMVKDRVKDMGHDDSEVNYMDLHLDAIKNPEKAGSMQSVEEHADPDMEKIVKELEGASKMHLAQSKRIRKHIDSMKEEETEIKEDWIDDEARKVERKWKRMSKAQKVKWRDKIDDMAAKRKMSDAELEDVLDDYGLTMEQKVKEKLESWGIKLRKEGYMILPSIDREKYTPMRGLEGPFMTRSGKVLYYDPKAGEYYDRDTDIYVSYDQYLEYDKESAAQKDLMKKGVMADPKSPQFKKMMRDKEKSAKDAKKQQAKLKMESVGMRLARKHYQGVK